MRTRILTITCLLLLSLVAGVAPAAAGGHSAHGNSFHATISGWETGFSPGPNVGRCPGGTEWMLFTAGTGEAAGLGAFDYTSEHCSRVVTLTPAGAIGKLAAGVAVFTFDAANKLYIGYQGTWKFDGNLLTGDGTAKVHQSYNVTGGTGMFEGAKGHGHFGGVDDFHQILMDLDGGLILAG